MGIPADHNNEQDWEQIENRNGTKTIIIDTEKSIIDDIEFHELEITEIASDDFDITKEDFNKKEDNFEEVLQLTQYTDGMLTPAGGSNVIAEYKDVEVSKSHQINAKNFVNKITKFILDFNDVNLSEEHKKYIKHVGQFQLSQLQDLLELTDINKQMLTNIVARVNATQAEDYAIIASYNSLVNQHLKLLKELQNTYRAIPNILKKMKADVLTNQEIDGEANLPINEKVGETQFTNQKSHLKSLAEKYKSEKTEKNPENEEA